MGQYAPSSTRFVYFILDEQSGALKIGASTEPERRLLAIQTGHPFELRLLFYVHGSERGYHEEFAEHHLRGEWYRYDGRLREFCDTRVLRRPTPEETAPSAPLKGTVLRHPRRTEAEALIREGRLRRWQIADQCEASKETVSRWAKEMGVRIKGTGRIRRKEGAA